MKLNIRVLAAGVCAVAMGLMPAGAIAKQYNITVNGTASGSGGANPFGLTNKFSDISFTVVFQYRDDANGAHYWADGHTADGGSIWGSVSPVTLKSLTLNGVTNYFSDFTDQNAGGADVQDEYTYYGYSGFNISKTDGINTNLTMTYPAGHDPKGLSDVYSGAVTSAVKDKVANLAEYYTNNNRSLIAYLKPSTIEVTALSAVPEASQWTLMLGGFGLAGMMLRRRRPALQRRTATI